MEKQEITRFIGQHSAWKTRLKRAIDSGDHSMVVHDVRRDDQCDFGKWLNSLPPGARANGHYTNVVSLHSDFHREAASVLELVQAGQHDKANEAIGLRGPFTAASTKLTTEMTKWRESL